MSELQKFAKQGGGIPDNVRDTLPRTMSELQKFAKWGGGYPGQCPSCKNLLSRGGVSWTMSELGYPGYCIVRNFFSGKHLIRAAEGNDTMCNL